MGMITRVRARLQSIHSLTKIERKLQDERTSHTVCLLSIVLLLPYFMTRLEPNALLSSAGLAYSCLVLPMVVSANYKYPVSLLRTLFHFLKGTIHGWLCLLGKILCRLLDLVNRCEKIYIGLANAFSLTSQFLVFVVCDHALGELKLTSLYSLMFYNILAYCYCYMKEMATRRRWTLSIHLDSRASIRHVAMSTTRMVLEWTRAVTYAITMVFVMLVFGLKQGLTHCHPSWTYIGLTGSYYVMTEKIFASQLPVLLTYLHSESLESLEYVYGNVFLKSLTGSIAFLVAVLSLFQGSWKLSTITLYLCVWLRWKDLSSNELAALRQHHRLLARYRIASSEELVSNDDVCPVCLWPMRFARVTPCQHLFHGDCLRRCLEKCDRCPLCKRQFKFD